MTLQGDALPQQPAKPATKSEPVAIRWDKKMTLDGREVRYMGKVTAEQEHAPGPGGEKGHSRLCCEHLDVTLDKPISLKEGEKKDQSPAIKYVHAWQSVIAEDTDGDQEQIHKLQRFEGSDLETDNKEGKVTSVGKGIVKIWELAGEDPGLMQAPGSGSGSRKQPKNGDEMKLTHIKYGNSMSADKKKNLVQFRGGVEVFNLPSTSPDVELDRTKLLPGCFYMRSENLLVLKRQEKVRNYQVMEAWGDKVIVQSPEIFGQASRVSYDEEKDQIIFMGENGSRATVTKIQPGVKPSLQDTVTAQRITYDRKTGILRSEGIEGMQGGGPRR
jgi:lipopolysaccharide export system protein LptA